jgi:hypothetical protein
MTVGLGEGGVPLLTRVAAPTGEPLDAHVAARKA